MVDDAAVGVSAAQAGEKEEDEEQRGRQHSDNSNGFRGNELHFPAVSSFHCTDRVLILSLTIRLFNVGCITLCIAPESSRSETLSAFKAI